MDGQFRYGLLITGLVICGVLVAGCPSQAPAVMTPVPTTVPEARYVSGDIIGKTTSSADTMLYLIVSYDRLTDQYTRTWIYRNTDGSWGYRIDNRTEKAQKALVEKVYPVKVAHVTVSSVPISTPTVPATVRTTLSGNAPTITGISPKSGGKDTTVGMTVTGTNFRSGALVKLIQPGYPSVQATGVTVSSATQIDCIFNLRGVEKGLFNVVVTNPDGQSDSLSGAFTIGEPGPVISGVNPSTIAINETLPLVISGQNFKDAVRITLTKGSAELLCTSPRYKDATSVSCDLRIPGGTAVGDWNLTILNIADQQSGTWNHAFTVTK